MSNWPTNLPQQMLLSGFKEKARNKFNSFQPDVGPSILRSKATKVKVDIQGNVILTQAQFAVLLEFYYDNLAGGTLPFTWKHPRSQAVTTFKFEDVPERSGIDGDKTLVGLKLSYIR